MSSTLSGSAWNVSKMHLLYCSNRIVVHGEKFARAVVPFSAKPFNFQTEYGLTEEQVTTCGQETCFSWHKAKNVKYFNSRHEHQLPLLPENLNLLMVQMCGQMLQIWDHQ